MKNKAWMAVGGVVLLVAAGTTIGYQLGQKNEETVAPVSVQQEMPTQEKPTQEKPKVQEPPVQQDANQKPTDPVPKADGGSGSGAVSFTPYQGEGTVSLADKGLKNNAFQVESLVWSSARKSFFVVGKMRAFEAVGYVRVRDEQKQIVFPETVVRAAEGAPAWSKIQAEIPIEESYKGKVLNVEFYVKSAKDGSRQDMLTVKVKPE
jgi:hypothetical protein